MNLGRTSDGATPLHIAAAAGNTDLLEVLLQLGSEPNATCRNMFKDGANYTALDIVLLGGRDKSNDSMSSRDIAKCAKILRRAGAEASAASVAEDLELSDRDYISEHSMSGRHTSTSYSPSSINDLGERRGTESTTGTKRSLGNNISSCEAGTVFQPLTPTECAMYSLHPHARTHM